jgi:predicted PurR-regulated permease PerM
MNDGKTINISSSAIFKTVIIVLGIYFLYIIRDVLALFFVSFILASAIEPIADWMVRKKIPRTAAVSIIYLAIFLLIAGVIYLIIPPLVGQLEDFFKNFPSLLEKSSGISQGITSYFQQFNIQGQNLININDKLSSWSGNIFSTTVGVFNGFFSVIIVFSLTFYLSLRRNGIDRAIAAITPKRYSEYFIQAIRKIKTKIGKWVQGQLVIMFVVFALDLIALSILHIPYALVLSILGGFLEIIPYIGPIVSAIPAIILGFLVSPLIGILVIPIYVIIQQIESHVVVPQVMKKAVGLDPIIVILALLVGAKLGGILGAILAVPIAAAIDVFFTDHPFNNRENEN